jgi:hypothetical protein
LSAGSFLRGLQHVLAKVVGTEQLATLEGLDTRSCTLTVHKNLLQAKKSDAFSTASASEIFQTMIVYEPKMSALLLLDAVFCVM